jgi:hypothetical protein
VQFHIDWNRDFGGKKIPSNTFVSPNISIIYSLFLAHQRQKAELALQSAEQDIEKLLGGGEI